MVIEEPLLLERTVSGRRPQRSWNENNNVGPFRQQEVSQFKKLSE